MALERKWLSIAPVSFTANGTQFGVVTVADTVNFKDKQIVVLTSTTIPETRFQIKRVLSNTQLIVGPPNNSVNPTDFSNISNFTVSDSATIQAAEQDKLAQPTDKDHYFAIYESSPTNADRIIPVDPYGNLIGPDNPLSVAFSAEFPSTVEIKGSPSGDLLNVNADGSINVNVIETPVSGQIVVSNYNQVLNVPSGSPTQLITYTVPAATTAVLQRIVVSGDNIARYDVFYNTNPFDTQRTMFGSNLNASFEYTTGTSNGFTLNTGDNLIVQVINPRPYPADYNVRIQLLEIS